MGKRTRHRVHRRTVVDETRPSRTGGEARLYVGRRIHEWEQILPGSGFDRIEAAALVTQTRRLEYSGTVRGPCDV